MYPMFPIEVYRITPNLFGQQRWQAEITGQRSRFARRGLSYAAARRKMARDENRIYDGGTRLMQTVWLPLTMPARRWHDQLCFERERARKRARKARA
jgi:hypothetical protein